jgi:recombinational DNA repair ATPase RecF
MAAKKKGKLEELLKDREEFLKQNPELREFQKKIDLALLEAGDDPHARMTVLVKMMMQQLGEELLPAVEELIEPYQNVISLNERMQELKDNLEEARKRSELDIIKSPKKKIVH